MVTIKLFLASSNELETERDKFASLINQLNRIFKPRGLEIDLIIWEYLNSSMSLQRKQDEYNAELEQCDICIVIFWNQLGKYTREEFKTAYDRLCAGLNPKRLYVFFKEPAIMTEEMSKFKSSFEENFGHFYSIFKNSDTLKLHFLLQLEIFKNEMVDISKLIAVQNSFITVAEIPFIDLRNVSFAAQNNNYANLQQQIKKQRNRLAKYPDDLEEQSELHILLEKRQKMENNMISLARKLSEQTLHKMSARMIDARKLFECGEVQAVVKLLETQDIMSDIKSSKAKIKLYNTMQEHELSSIELAINEIQLRIKAEKVLLEAGWTEKIANEYKILIEEVRGYTSPLFFSKILFEAAKFIEDYTPDISAIPYYIECIETMKSLKVIPYSEQSVYGDMLFFTGRFFTETVYEIDCDPTNGEWIDALKERIHARVIKRWKDYRKRAKENLTKSVDVFCSLNESGIYDKDIYYSLKQLTSYGIWNGNEKGRRLSFNRLITFVRNSKLPQEFLLSCLSDYAIELFYGSDRKEFDTVFKECEKIIEALDLTKLRPEFLLNISNLFEMKQDFRQAGNCCRKALRKFENLSKDDPFIWQHNIADCLERLARYVSRNTETYMVNPETFNLLDKAERIFNSLYEATGSNVYWRRKGHIKNLRFEFQLRERMDFGAFIFGSILNDLKNYFSSHITSGKHMYNIDSYDGPIKNIGTIIRKVRNKDEYKLFFTWEIDEWRCQRASIGKFGFESGTKDDIYTYLTSSDCYDCLCQSIIRDLDKSWNMD